MEKNLAVAVSFTEFVKSDLISFEGRMKEQCTNIEENMN